jgi:hypothetical protein
LRPNHHRSHLPSDGPKPRTLAVAARLRRGLAVRALSILPQIHANLKAIIESIQSNGCLRVPIGPFLRSTAASRSTTSAKHAKNLLGKPALAERESREPSRKPALLLRILPGGSGCVVHAAAIGVGQDFVRFLDALEYFCVAALVGVVLSGHLSVGLFDFVGARLGGHI